MSEIVQYVPKEAKRYMHFKDDTGCTTWTGMKFYGRPWWKLWMQRAVYEEAHGTLPSKTTVSETCGTHGCLSVAHLTSTVRVKSDVAFGRLCQTCHEVLKRDKNNKTYCTTCLAAKARERRRKI